MKKNNINITKLVRKVIEESLQEKADELTSKVKTKMDEWTPNEPVNIQGMQEETDDYIMDKIKRECEENPESESCKKHKEYAGINGEVEEISTKDLRKGKKYKYKSPSFEDELEFEKEDEYPQGKPMYSFKGKEMKHSMGDKSIEDFVSDIDEELIGGQKKLDKNKNGKLDSEDFKILRKGKKTEQSEVWSSDDSEDDYFDDDFDDFEIPKKKNKGTDDRYTAFDKVRMGYEPEDIDWEEIDSEDIDEEMEEGNEFTGALAKAKEEGKKEFEVGGKKFPVKESLQLTESELIDLIEKIVSEEKKLVGAKPKGLSQTEKVLSADKKENDEYLKSVTKKLTDYLKNGSKGKYEVSPKNFPKGNNQLAKMNKKAYTPSDAVEEYVDAFAYPGQTNLVFDEIKPNDENIKKYLKGDKKTGNAEVDEDGKALGNVVPSEVGEKFYKNYEENLFGQEQMNASYKRYPQDTIEVAGDVTKKGKLKKSNKKTAQSVLNKVEESSTKKNIILNEEFDRMKNLIGYKQKTQ